MISNERITSLLDEYLINPSKQEFYNATRGCLKHKKDGRTVATLFTKGYKLCDGFILDLYFEDKDLESATTLLKAIDEQMTEYLKEFFVKSELYLQFEEAVEENFEDCRDLTDTIWLDAGGGEVVGATESDIERIEAEILEDYELYYTHLGELYFDELQQPILEAIGGAK